LINRPTRPSARHQFAAGSIKLDADHQALAANRDQACAAGQRLRQTLPNQATDGHRVVDQAVLFDHRDGRQAAVVAN
jgi:hypothetical protein